MKKWTLLVLVFLLHSVGFVPFSEASETVYATPVLTKNQVWLGAGAGLVLGFGSGQSIQNRWSEAGWPFTLTDGVAAIALLSTFGDCLSCSQSANDTRNTVRGVGAGLFIVSRVLQVGELILYGVKNENRRARQQQKKVSWILLPNPDSNGGMFLTSIRF